MKPALNIALTFFISFCENSHNFNHQCDSLFFGYFLSFFSHQ
uniref:Uncharacterized protein n=1 Tax=Rhizophora mucronata TaxID=61149 RepID=A0A2P2MWJ4_RHIMU